MCVCVCEREGEGERDREREKERFVNNKLLRFDHGLTVNTRRKEMIAYHDHNQNKNDQTLAKKILL